MLYLANVGEGTWRVLCSLKSFYGVFEETASLCLTSHKWTWFCCCCNHVFHGIGGWSPLGGANMCLQFSIALIYHATFNVCYWCMKFNILLLEDQFLEICPLTFHGWGMIQSVHGLAVAACNWWQSPPWTILKTVFKFQMIFLWFETCLKAAFLFSPLSFHMHSGNSSQLSIHFYYVQKTGRVQIYLRISLTYIGFV